MMTRGPLLLPQRGAGLWSLAIQCTVALLAGSRGYAQPSYLSARDLRVFVHSPYSPGSYETSREEATELEPVAPRLVPAPRVLVVAPANLAGEIGDNIVATFGMRAGEQRGTLADPFDLSWHHELDFARVATAEFSSLLTATLAERLQLGAGVDMMWTDSDRDLFFPALSGLQTLKSEEPRRYETDVSGLRGNVGLGVRVTERQSVSLSYRTPFEIDYRGSTASALGGGVFRTEMKTQVKFPTILGAGYGIQVTERLKVHTQLEWLQFSKLKDLPLLVANDLPGLPGSVNENWRDTFSLGLGGVYRLGEHWFVRAGYQFYQSPVPSSSGPSAITTVDQNVLTVGIGFSHSRHTLQASYGVDLYDSLSLGNGQNPASNDSHNFTVHLLAFAYRLVF